MRIVFSGTIGRSVTGGQAWANLQYLIGLTELGHDVLYLEDCGEWSASYDWETQLTRDDIDFPAAYIRDCLEPCGFGEKWAYRAADETRGLSLDEIKTACRRADLLIVRAVPFLSWRAEYELPVRRVFIDVDPGFTQYCLQRGELAFVDTLSRCEVLFTVGQNVGHPTCSIPVCDRDWLPTLPPVSMSHWDLGPPPDDSAFTTVIRWRGMKDVEFGGRQYGQRDQEFKKLLALPSRTSQPVKIALTGGNLELFRDHGWQAVEGWTVSKTPEMYREFIASSRGEFGIAKNTYVEAKSGWVSDRTVCYLASGRPALVQETGFSDYLPSGEGLVSFQDLDQAIEKIENMNHNYSAEQCAAREIAREHMSSKTVLPKFLEQAMG